MSQLSKYYAKAKEALPQAVAISIISGIQTQDEGKPLEWWTVTTHTETIGHPLNTRRAYNGDTFDSALAQAIIGEL